MMDIMLGVLTIITIGAMLYIVSKWLNEKW